MTACGLDFGTSNSTVGCRAGAGAARLLALEDGRPTLPSAVFFHVDDGHTSFGRAAMADYLEGHEGRLMRSLKSVLGSALLDDMTAAGGRSVSFRDILARFVAELKARAERAAERPLEAVVLGRPVRFVDDDDAADQAAEAALVDSARRAGFREIALQFEPIAAAFDHEATMTRESIVLVADLGGGTCDFTIARLGPDRADRADRRDDVLANTGVHVGGTDLDRAFSLAAAMPAFGYGGRLRNGRQMPSAPYFDLATWHLVNTLYARRQIARIEALRREAADPAAIERLLCLLHRRDGHWLAAQVEAAKVALSQRADAQFPIERRAGTALMVTRAALESAIAPLVERIERAVREALAAAGLASARIETVLFTGGSSLVPLLRDRIASIVPQARPADGDVFGAVGLGLALDAQRRFG